MIDIKDKVNCCGCHACFNICPKNAIIMEEDEKGFKYPEINKKKCIDCKLCEKVCPILKEKNTNNTPVAYACYNKNKKIRINSSSGGIFTLIAEEIINLGGVVFGAILDSDFNVVHAYTERANELCKFRGSKYVQSIIGNNYEKAKKFLESGRYVLFTGTPCQIEGLYSYLQKDYDRLYTQDIICHGVPSTKVWNVYKNYLEKNHDSKIEKIEFRNKKTGWASYSVRVKFQNGKEYKKINSHDLYMQAFLRNFCLRDSCYNCNFKKENRVSDITLADFWGIQKIVPEMDDNKGTSLVIINSKKGEETFDNIKEEIKYIKVNFNQSIIYNSSINTSAKIPKNKESFFNNLDKIRFDRLVKKYIPKRNILKSNIIIAKRIIKKIINR